MHTIASTAVLLKIELFSSHFDQKTNRYLYRSINLSLVQKEVLFWLQEIDLLVNVYTKYHVIVFCRSTQTALCIVKKGPSPEIGHVLTHVLVYHKYFRRKPYKNSAAGYRYRMGLGSLFFVCNIPSATSCVLNMPSFQYSQYIHFPLRKFTFNPSPYVGYEYLLPFIYKVG